MIIERNKLTPDEGFKYISNGEVWSELVFLGRTDSVDNWHDTNDEPPEPEDDEEAAVEDYENALGRFGV